MELTGHSIRSFVNISSLLITPNEKKFGKLVLVAR